MVRIQYTHKTEGASKAPVKLVLSAIRKEGEEVAFDMDVNGELFDVVQCAALMVDKLLAEFNIPADVLCGIINGLEELRKDSAIPTESNPGALGMMFASSALSAAEEEHRKKGN